jgi:hypothetical protein
MVVSALQDFRGHIVRLVRKSTVPTTVDITFLVLIMPLVLLNWNDSPKSITFMGLSGYFVESRKFSGLRSLWATPFSWQYETAYIISRKTACALLSVNCPASMIWSNNSPPRHSLVKIALLHQIDMVFVLEHLVKLDDVGVVQFLQDLDLFHELLGL